MIRRILSGLASLALSLTAGLLALEVGLRVLGMGNDALMRPHPWVGWVPIPGRVADVAQEDSTLGRRATIRINRLGMRDVERVVTKAPGVTRVLVLGDSYVEAQQVPADSGLTRRLERALDRPERRVEVWNGGVSGYGTAQELLYLRHVAAAWKPDLVVLCFLSGNDVADATPEHATSLRNRPFFRLDGDSLALDRGQFRDDPPGVGWLRTHSRAFTWASTLRQAMRAKARARAALASAGDRVPEPMQIYAASPDASWERAWDVTLRLVTAVRDEARAQGAGFLLVGISNGAQEHPRARTYDPEWIAWGDRPGLVLDAPERRLAALAARDTLDWLPLLPAFASEQASTGQPLHIRWTGHWNSAGHALAAREIAPRIEAWMAGREAAGGGAEAGR